MTVSVQGIPETFEANKTYPLTVSVAGGPTPIPAVSQNQGGFALKVSDGTLLADDGITVTGGKFATHSAETNNQRSWSLEWAAPQNPAGPVTINVAANSVNGDGTSGGGLDQWNRATFTMAPAVSGGDGNTTQSPSATPTDGATSGLSFVVGSLIVASAVVLRRRHN